MVSKIKTLPVFFMFLLILPGCLATRDWVSEQLSPRDKRAAEAEGRIDQAGNRLSGAENRISGAESRLSNAEGKIGQVDAKAEKALNAISNLRLERKVVIDMKDGANFAFNSSNLPAQAQREIDGFMSDLKGDVTGEGAIFVVAGHTDNAGADNYNYDLGKRRAEAVSRYLILQKKVDPMRVMPVSYGESVPASDNSTAQGRAKNRRVEILVYREGITSTPTVAAAPTTPTTPTTPAEQPRSSSQQSGGSASQ